tara:strand:- start:845 stop:1000 length:156 start_codon:yes stop_codon:yes gene_type:complete
MPDNLKKILSISEELTKEKLTNPQSNKTLISKEKLDSMIEEILEQRRKSKS